MRIFLFNVKQTSELKKKKNIKTTTTTKKHLSYFNCSNIFTCLHDFSNLFPPRKSVAQILKYMTTIYLLFHLPHLMSKEKMFWLGFISYFRSLKNLKFSLDSAWSSLAVGPTSAERWKMVPPTLIDKQTSVWILLFWLWMAVPQKLNLGVTK